MYNLTIRGHDLTNVHSVEELAQTMKKMAIPNVQFAMNMSLPTIDTSKSGINPGMGTYFKNLFSDNDVQVAILSCYSNLIHPDAEIREQLLQKFESYLRHAEFFGASMVASETGSVIPDLGYTTRNFTDETFADLVTVVKRLVMAGEKYHTTVAIEAGLNHPLYSIQRTKQLVDEIPSDYLGIILDPTNLITTENHTDMVTMVKDAFNLYGDKIVALHLKDYIVEEDQIIPVNLGEGVIPYQEILDIVYKKRPYCYVVLEETRDEGIIKAKNILNS